MKTPANANTNWVYHADGPVNRIEASFSSAAFSPHRHDTYTIGMTLQGVQSFDYRGTTRNAMPGNLVILHPDEVHDGRAGTEDGFRYRTLYIEPAAIQRALGGRPLPFIEGGISSDPRLAKAIWPILDDLTHVFEDLEWHDAIFDLAMALGKASSASCGKPARPCANHAATEMARQLIHDNLDEGITLDELEHATGHDRWELSRDFRTLFGTSPHRYLTLRRLDRARTMMLSGNSIADTAAACAFADQSHFTRHFKKTWGMTPKKWAAAFSSADFPDKTTQRRTNVL